MSFVYDTIRIDNRIDVMTTGKICTNNKGDILVDDGTQTGVLGVGSNGQALIANSAQSKGIEWRNLVSSDVTDFDTEVGNQTDVTNNTSHVAASSSVHGLTGSVVGTTDTQTLTNKTLTDSTTYFQDNADTTKKLQLQLDGITTSTTRTLTVPDANTTIVGTDTTQILSAKTLTTPKVNDTSLDHTYNFGVSELTANRAITLPLLTGNDTFVFEAHSQSLTNKTFNADLNTLSNVDNADIKAGAAIDTTKIADGSVTNAEFQRINALASTAVGETDTQTLTNKTFTDTSTYFSDDIDNTKKAQLQLSGITTATTRTLTVPDTNTTITGTDAIQTLTNKTINSDNNTIINIVNADIKSGATIDATKIADGSVTDTEFQRLATIGSTAVGESDTQTITNKTLTDASTYFQDEGDNTKKLQLQLSGLTTSTTRTLTIPDANTTVVGTDTTQTLTNKSIDADNNTITNIDNADIKVAAAIDASKIADGSVSNTEFQRLAVVGSAVVGETDTQTLTNKTLLDSTTFFADDSDNTKKLQLQLSSISTSTTRTLTVPDTNTTIVGTNATQTITNKTWGDDLNMSSNKITSVAEPTASTDVATKSYVDASSSGLHAKEATRAKTVDALPAYTQSGTGIGATLTADANGVMPDIDGITLVANDRVLVDTNGTTSDVHNGLYTVTQVGDGSNPWILTRSTDADQDAEVEAGLYVFVTEGTCADCGFVLTTNNPIVVDTTVLNFTQYSGAGQIDAGTGMTKAGNTLNVGGSSTVIANADTLDVNSSSTINQILLSSGSVGTASTFGALPLGNSNAVSGILDIANGGTNVSSFTAGSRLLATNSGNTALETTSLDPANIITLTGTETLTNKTFTDSTTYFQDEVDNTKKLQLQLSGITTSTTRTLTVPDATTTIVGIDTAQTLTNKTIDADNNTITNIENADIKASATIDATKIANGSVSNTEFQYLSSLTSVAVGLTDSQILTNKTLTTPKINDTSSNNTYNFVVSELTDNRTITLPLLTGNDTFVFASHTDTLSNKTLTLPKVNDTSSDHTYNFAVSELAANRTIALPLLTGNDTFVFASHADTLLNKTLTTPKINDTSSNHTYDIAVSELAANRTVTMPLLTGNDTFVFESHTQTLINKTLTDSSTYFQDNADTTKKLQFQLSGITTSTTRTLTIPNANTTIVGTGTSQTLTNKTIDADNNTITNIDNNEIKAGAAIDATKIADGSVSNTEFQYLNGTGSTVVGESDSQTLTNKTFTDASTYIADNADNTKKVQFEVSGVTTSTIRTLTVPNANTTIVGTDATQTLTNKSIDSDNNTITNIANADIKSGAAVDATKIADGSVSNTEFQQLATVASPVVGTTDTQTLTNKTLTSPRVETAINDNNGNELIKVSATASAVNEITVTNAIATNGPTISATGNDTNIDLNIDSKGSGNVVVDSLKWPNSDGTTGQILKTDGSGNLSFANVDILDTGITTTTNGTATTILTSSTTSDKVYLVDVTVIGRRTDSGTEGAGFVLRGFYRNDGGTLTKIGDDKISAKDDQNWDANTAVSGTDVIVQVTGEAAKTINWKATCKTTVIG
jgi:hypothetical protein